MRHIGLVDPLSEHSLMILPRMRTCDRTWDHAATLACGTSMHVEKYVIQRANALV